MYENTRETWKVDFFIFEEIKENLIFGDDVLTVLMSKKPVKNKRKKYNLRYIILLIISINLKSKPLYQKIIMWLSSKSKYL